MNEEIITLVNQFYEISNGSWRLKTNRTAKTVDQIENNISQILTSNKKYSLMGELEDLADWLEGQLEESQMVTVQANVTPETYIIDTLKRHDIVIEGKGDRYYKQAFGTPINITSDGIVTLLKGDLWEFNRFLPRVQRLKEGDIVNKFTQMLLTKSHNTHIGLIRNMMHDKNNSTITDTWLEGLHKVMYIREPLSVWKMLMKHMMWLVKRHMYGKPVKNDIWLQVMGAFQSSGKTYTARKCIFAPISDMYMETELSKIEDIDREVAKFTQYLVVNFDEIALGNSGDPQYKIGKKMLNNLKSILTRDEIIVRTYHTQRQEKQKKTFTAFSTANTHLYDVIYDETGMRRFFEFNTDATKQFDNAKIAELGELSVQAWVGIDENLVDGYWDKNSEDGKFVTQAQENYFPTFSTVKMWSTDRNVTKGDTTLVDAYGSYKDYCRNTGNSYVCSLQSFTVDMRKLFKDLIDANGAIKIQFDEEV